MDPIVQRDLDEVTAAARHMAECLAGTAEEFRIAIERFDRAQSLFAQRCAIENLRKNEEP